MDLRRAILDASVALIAAEGLEALSMREVARKLKVTHGAPYYHFKDRAEILAALTEEGLHDLTQTMRDAVERAGPKGRDRLEACGRAYVSFAVLKSAHFKIMNRPELTLGKNAAAIENLSAGAFRVLLEVVQQCQAEGASPGLDPHGLALTAWSTAHGLAALCVDGRLAGKADVEDLSRIVAETFGALVAGGRNR